jgi:hypothetical protein
MYIILFLWLMNLLSLLKDYVSISDSWGKFNQNNGFYMTPLKNVEISTQGTKQQKINTDPTGGVHKYYHREFIPKYFYMMPPFGFQYMFASLFFLNKCNSLNLYLYYCL